MSKKKYTFGEYLQVYLFVGGLFALTAVAVVGNAIATRVQIEKLERLEKLEKINKIQMEEQ